MKGKPVIPDELRFAITRKCNGSCRHCYNQSGKDSDRLSSDDFIRLIKEVHALNPNLDRITLTGGEPLNETDKVLDVARFAHSLGIRVRLVTRGWELNQELCHRLKAAGVTRIQIGLDSSGLLSYYDELENIWDTWHSWLRGDHSGFIKTFEAIKMAVSTGMDVSIRYSLGKSNLGDVVNTYQLVSSLGVSKFKFRVLFPDGRAKKQLLDELISGENMANAQYGLIQASRENRTTIEITQPCYFPLPGKNNLPIKGIVFNAFKESCPCGTVAAYIDSNGDVKYCLFDEDTLGNVCSESFITVWNSVAAEEARKYRCPLDKSGTDCSSFKILYSQSGDYSTFIKSYIEAVKRKIF